MTYDPQAQIDGETTCAICGAYAQWFAYPRMTTADVRCENDHVYEVDAEGEMIVRTVAPGDFGPASPPPADFFGPDQFADDAPF